MSEPVYDEDLVNLGYLKKTISQEKETIAEKYQEVSRHYGSRPSPPYTKGDTWIDGNIVYTCINSREIGNYNDDDWVTESGAKEEAKRKNKIFLTRPSDYNSGDMWILQSDNDHKAGRKGEILVTTVTRKEYDENDWVNELGYGTIRSINEVVNNLNDAISRIGNVEEAVQDGLIVTYYQDTIPEGKHIGDLWYVTAKIEGYIKGKIYRYDGESWTILDDPAIQKAFDEANEARLVADGKIQSFYSVEEPTSNVGVGDLWIDINDSNKLYRYNGTKWIPVYDTRIEEVFNNVEKVSRRVVEISTDLGSVQQQVSEIANIARKVTQEDQLYIKKAMPIEPGRFKVYGNSTYFKYLYPSDNLYPSEDLYPAGDYFTLCIDKQSRNNPSGELKEYVINLEEPLRHLGDICDEFYVSNVDNTAKVIRRIGINTDGTLYVLENEVEEIIGELHLTLLEGENYIYVKEFRNLKYEIEYVILNDFTTKYATNVAVKALLKITSDSINAEVSKKVDGDKIISTINQTAEKIKILARLLQLEGYTTINGGFSIDEKGNASIANGSVNINTKGIQMADGTAIIGGDGMLTNFQFVGTAHYIGRTTCGALEFIGAEADELNGRNVKSFIEIYAYLPENFIVKEAYITLIHQPVVYESENTTIYGYSRNLALFEGNVADSVGAIVGSDYYEEDDVLYEIVQAFGSNGYTPSIPTANDRKLEMKKSSNIKDNLIPGQATRLVLETRNEVPTFNSNADILVNMKNCAEVTGRVCAFLDVYGYMNISEEVNNEEN